jgi:hypothetical protein
LLPTLRRCPLHAATDDQRGDDRPALSNDREDDKSGKKAFGPKLDEAIASLEREDHSGGRPGDHDRWQRKRSDGIELADEFTALIGCGNGPAGEPSA